MKKLSLEEMLASHLAGEGGRDQGPAGGSEQDSFVAVLIPMRLQRLVSYLLSQRGLSHGAS